ncbi:hypothetical protein AB0D68_11130 [Streptomyces sp. NPDC048212]|uniref:hypothetical protein n=1 Tax=Streptomyces sp. NPDC048212 TaxID=3156658 RepID=UPI0033F5B66F
MDPKYRIKKSRNEWALFAPLDTRPMAFGSFDYCVSMLNYSLKFDRMSSLKRWKDG